MTHMLGGDVSEWNLLFFRQLIGLWLRDWHPRWNNSLMFNNGLN